MVKVTFPLWPMFISLFTPPLQGSLGGTDRQAKFCERTQRDHVYAYLCFLCTILYHVPGSDHFFEYVVGKKCTVWMMP